MVKKKKLNKGFTLIELIVVIAILGILMAIVTPNFLEYRKTAKEQAENTTVETYKRAIQMVVATEEKEIASVSSTDIADYVDGTVDTALFTRAQTELGVTPAGP